MENVVDEELYHLSAMEDAVHFASALLAYEVQITYVCGYGDAEDVPAAVRQGMLLHLATLYDDRMGGMQMPVAAVALYKPHRKVRL